MGKRLSEVTRFGGEQKVLHRGHALYRRGSKKEQRVGFLFHKSLEKNLVELSNIKERAASITSNK